MDTPSNPYFHIANFQWKEGKRDFSCNGRRLSSLYNSSFAYHIFHPKTNHQPFIEVPFSSLHVLSLLSTLLHLPNGNKLFMFPNVLSGASNANNLKI